MRVRKILFYPIFIVLFILIFYSLITPPTPKTSFGAIGFSTNWIFPSDLNSDENRGICKSLNVSDFLIVIFDEKGKEIEKVFIDNDKVKGSEALYFYEKSGKKITPNQSSCSIDSVGVWGVLSGKNKRVGIYVNNREGSTLFSGDANNIFIKTGRMIRISNINLHYKGPQKIKPTVKSYEKLIVPEPKKSPLPIESIDDSPPVNTTKAGFIDNGRKKTDLQEVSLSISATDDVGVTGYYASENPLKPSAKENIGWNEFVEQKQYSTVIPFTLSNNDGDKLVYIWFKDRAGNISLSAKETINLDRSDRIAPENTTDVNLIRKVDSKKKRDSIFLKISATDNIGVTGYFISEELITKEQLESANWITVASAKAFSKEIPYELPDKTGIKIFYVWFRDGAGNISKSAEMTIRIENGDNEPPENTTLDNFIDKGNKYTNKSVVMFRISATDDFGVTGYYLGTNDLKPELSSENWQLFDPIKKYSKDITYPFNKREGEKTVFVWFRDGAGNISQSKSDSILYSANDFVPPINTTRSNFINHTDIATSFTKVLIEISATDNLSVNHYLASESSVAPLKDDERWIDVKPADNFSGKFSFNLSNSNGEKKIYVWFKDDNGNVSNSASDSIIKAIIDRLPDSGQTQRYTDEKFSGEDGDYTNNSISYVDNRDDTVTDKNTGLMWQKRDDNILRSFEDALSYCDKFVFGKQKYSDWRLPTALELITILDYSTDSPTVNLTFFPGTKSAFYWTSTNYAEFSNMAWYVDFRFGFVGYYRYKTNLYNTKCVRGNT